MRVSKSAMGSVITAIFLLPFSPELVEGSCYHDALVTPGMLPLCAFSRKQMRHSANLRYTPRGRPQSWQRLCARTLNFGVRLDFSMRAVLAINVHLLFGAANPLPSGTRSPLRRFWRSSR